MPIYVRSYVGIVCYVLHNADGDPLLPYFLDLIGIWCMVLEKMSIYSMHACIQLLLVVCFENGVFTRRICI